MMEIVATVKQKYTIKAHYLPHDAQVHEFTSGKTRAQSMREL